jgi:hypothetical protein
MAKSTADQLSMFDPPICADLPSAISSPGSAGGVTRSGSPAGPTIDPSGRDRVPVNRSRAPAPVLGAMIPAIFGRRGFGSSASAGLQSSLANRLRQRFDTGGSIWFSETWKELVTPRGRRCWAHTASGRRISDNGSTSWLGHWMTPHVVEQGESPETKDARNARLRAAGQMKGCGSYKLSTQVLTMSAWPMPNTPSGGRSVSIETMDATGKTIDGRKHTASLEHAAKFASWPTATVHDAERGGQSTRAMGETRHGSNLQDFAMLVGWPTPTRQDAASSGSLNYPKTATHQPGTTLTDASRLASWATPMVADATGSGVHQHTLTLCQQVRTSGAILSGSPAATASSGQLNPAFSRWLMGYPVAWDDCAATATQSFRMSRRRSLPRTTKRGRTHE